MSVKALELESLTIDGARAAVVSGETTATALAELHYGRIEAQDEEINSFLALSRERALGQAATIDAMAAKGDELPVLAGVPIGIKDVLAMQGVPATAGSLILKGYRPPYDASVVTKLEAAGAVLLGKLNCDEFAMGSSNENSAYGPVLNPKALDRVPGGSSGGSAAAVAANFAVATLGNGYGGVDPAAGGFLRRGGRTSDVWAGQPVWIDCLCIFAGPGGAVYQECEGCGDIAAGDCGTGCYGCDLVGSTCGGLCRRVDETGGRYFELVCRRSTLARGWIRRFAVQLRVCLLV